MTINKSIFLLIIILALLIIILPHVKNSILYHPLSASNEKYNKFYQKLLQLVELKSYLQNYKIETMDGITLDAIYLKNPDTAKCIIFFHGNAGNISTRFDVIKFLYNYASVITFDYRSFGKSTDTHGLLSAKSLRIDAEAIWNYVIKKLGIYPNNISFFGESLGCAVALNLAATLSKNMDDYYYPHSIICNAAFSSLVSMAEEIFNNVNLGFVGRLIGIVYGSDYKPIDDIKFINHKTKIILAHSPNDEIVPYTESKKLYNTIKDVHPNIFFISITGTHNNLGLTDEYIYGLANLFYD